jgi:hypothetical protein
VAVGRSILVIVWSLLPDPEVHFCDLGAGLDDTHSDAEHAKRHHIGQLEAHGDTVTLQPAAGVGAHPPAWTRVRRTAPGTAPCPLIMDSRTKTRPLVRAGSARHQEPLVLGGHER